VNQRSLPNSRTRRGNGREVGSIKEEDMRRKIVLAVVLCLAAMAFLGAGASAAAAATCTDCHFASPDGPPAPHDLVLAGVADCTTCHQGWSPHPGGLRSLTLTLKATRSATGDELKGTLTHPGFLGATVGMGDVRVYLQQRLWGETEFTDLTEMMTDSAGAYAYTVASPKPFAAYRAISEGVVGPSSLWRAMKADLLPTQKLTLKLSPLTDGVLKLGQKLVASGTVTPRDPADLAVVFLRQKKHGEKWVYDGVEGAYFADDGTFSRAIYKPATVGSYRVRPTIRATNQHAAATWAWRYFRVK
jgi:hypothetical protein